MTEIEGLHELDNLSFVLYCTPAYNSVPSLKIRGLHVMTTSLNCPGGQRLAVIEQWNVSPRDVGGGTKRIQRMYFYTLRLWSPLNDRGLCSPTLPIGKWLRQPNRRKVCLGRNLPRHLCRSTSPRNDLVEYRNISVMTETATVRNIGLPRSDKCAKGNGAIERYVLTTTNHNT